jgi:hypothetical protein
LEQNIDRLLRALRLLRLALILLLVHIALYWLPYTLPNPIGDWYRLATYHLVINDVGDCEPLLPLAAVALVDAVWRLRSLSRSRACRHAHCALLVWAGVWLAWCLLYSVDVLADMTVTDVLFGSTAGRRNFYLLGDAIFVVGAPIGTWFLLVLNRDLDHLLMSGRQLRMLLLLALLAAALWAAFEIYWEMTAGDQLRQIWSHPFPIMVDPPPGAAPHYRYLEVGMQQIPMLLLLLLSLLRIGLTRRRIMHRSSRCLRCGYDLRGAAHERCPECGGRVWRGGGR